MDPRGRSAQTFCTIRTSVTSTILFFRFSLMNNNVVIHTLRVDFCSGFASAASKSECDRSKNRQAGICFVYRRFWISRRRNTRDPHSEQEKTKTRAGGRAAINDILVEKIFFFFKIIVPVCRTGTIKSESNTARLRLSEKCSFSSTAFSRAKFTRLIFF